jgi:hypothetical protein
MLSNKAQSAPGRLSEEPGKVGYYFPTSPHGEGTPTRIACEKSGD